MTDSKKITPTKPQGSHLEHALACQLRLAGIEYETQVKAVTGRRFAFDFAFPTYPAPVLLVEVQGAVWGKGAHTSGVGVNRDCEKAALATIAGYRVIAVTGNQIKSGEALRWIQQLLQVAA